MNQIVDVIVHFSMKKESCRWVHNLMPTDHCFQPWTNQVSSTDIEVTFISFVELGSQRKNLPFGFFIDSGCHGLSLNLRISWCLCFGFLFQVTPLKLTVCLMPPASCLGGKLGRKLINLKTGKCDKQRWLIIVCWVTFLGRQRNIYSTKIVTEPNLIKQWI